MRVSQTDRAPVQERALTIRARWSGLVLGLVLAALVFAIPFAGRLMTRPGLGRIHSAIEGLPFRTSEARLSVDRGYRPPPEAVRGDRASDRIPGDLMILLDRSDGAALPLDGVHARGLARLIAGNADASTRWLRRAVRRPDLNEAGPEIAAALWNDLAVAEYEVGRGGNAVSFLAALDAIERSRRLASSPNSLWTRAVILEQLGLRAAAENGWRDYLVADPVTEWAVEARRRLELLTAPRAEQFESKTLLNAVSRGDTALVDRIAARFPQQTRMYAEEELLPQWAAAHLQRADREGADLEALRVIASAVTRVSGEALLTDVVSALEESADSPGHRSALAEAIQQYAIGRNAYVNGDVARAERELAGAEEALRSAGSPLWYQANVYRAAAVYSGNRYREASATLLEPDPGCTRCRSYFANTGLRGWIRGLASTQTGQPAAAADAYEQALEGFRRAGETQNIAAVLNLRSEALDYMTASEEAWIDRMNALTLFDQAPIGQRPLMWMGVALAALRDQREHAAAAILGEIAADARRRDDPMWMAEAGMWRAICRFRSGQTVSDEQLDEIRRTAARIADRSIRARTEANLRLVLAELRPGRAAEDLAAALQFYRQSEDRFNGTEALAQEAVSRAASADFSGAGASLNAALAEIQRQAGDVPDPLMRALFADRARTLLTMAAEVESRRGRPEAALWLSDRARRVALQMFGSHEGAGNERTQDAEGLGKTLVNEVPDGVTVIHQDLVADQLRTWVIRSGKLHFVAAPVAGAALLDAIEQFRSDLESGASDVESQARHLYTVLFAPVRKLAGDDGLLLYSPSAALRGVPISALHDGERFVVEQRPVAVTLSVGTADTDGAGRHGRRALIASPPQAGRSSDLPGARSEAASLVRLYGSDAATLQGAEATPSAFLRLAPQFDVIHVASHGRTDRRPMQNAIEFGSGRVRAYDVLRLRLDRAPIVVLSGCRTDDQTEGRATISLAGAFSAAGASEVVGSLWNVGDRKTERLMTAFHGHLSRGATASEALSLAQRTAIRQGESPASWAAFQVHL
jgi:CHAT domain-containing protein